MREYICTVCGYIHQGVEPPGECPICGATSEYFEPYEAPQSAVSPESGKWRCLNCEYIHNGASPPAICPICGASARRFESYSAPEAGTTTGTDSPKVRIVIAGAGIAGVSAAQLARKHSAEAEILLISKEKELPYYRLNLTRYLAGEVTGEQLPLYPESWYREQGIRLVLGDELCSVNREQKRITLASGEETGYDKLILAMGSHPFIPPFPGISRANVTPLRSREDADFILREYDRVKNCLIIGGGVLGLETAAALARRGGSVSLLEGHGWLLPRQLNREAGLRLEASVSWLGITLIKEARVKEILGDERVRGVILEDGRTISTELVIITTGVRSNSYIARLCGLEVNQGIVVNNRLNTSDPAVFAAGDAAEHRGVVYGLWGPAQFQGGFAGLNAAGGSAEFAGIPPSNMLKVLDLDMFSIGRIRPEDAGDRMFDGVVKGNYYFFMFRDNYLAGAILLGDTTLSGNVKKLIESRSDCSGICLGITGVEDIISGIGTG